MRPPPPNQAQGLSEHAPTEQMVRLPAREHAFANKLVAFDNAASDCKHEAETDIRRRFRHNGGNRRHNDAASRSLLDVDVRRSDGHRSDRLKIRVRRDDRSVDLVVQERQQEITLSDASQQPFPGQNPAAVGIDGNVSDRPYPVERGGGYGLRNEDARSSCDPIHRDGSFEIRGPAERLRSPALRASRMSLRRAVFRTGEACASQANIHLPIRVSVGSGFSPSTCRDHDCVSRDRRQTQRNSSASKTPMFREIMISALEHKKT